MPKNEAELRQKLDQVLAMDATLGLPGCEPKILIGCKVGAAKALLWALGENDDDRWHIPATPGPAIEMKRAN